MKVIILIICFFCFLTQLQAQEKFRIMFYNAENLYDTKDNPKTNDNDLTPAGNLHWTTYRYWKKLNDISKVIISVGDGHAPALVGICEVENDSVLYDLTKKTNLKKEKYEYIITQSKDLRGSNVALLYQRDQMKVLGKKAYTPRLDTCNERTTRDILHVTGKVVNGDTLDIFVCHFPSRSEGIKKTRPFRISCSQLLRQKSDSLFRIRKKANIIIMGDFNDYPIDVSMSETLEAKSIESSIFSQGLYNLFLHKVSDKSIGTYKYRGKWNYLDQFVVSGNLLNPDSRVQIKDKAAYIYTTDFLLEEDKKYGGNKPFRTYSGYKYLGGISDHLPIYINLSIKK